MPLDPNKVNAAKPRVAEILKMLPGLHPVIHDEVDGWLCLRHNDCPPLTLIRTSDTPAPKRRARPENIGSGVTFPVGSDVLTAALSAMESAVTYFTARDHAKAAEGGNTAAPSWLTRSLTEAYNALATEAEANAPAQPQPAPPQPAPPVAPALVVPK